MVRHCSRLIASLSLMLVAMIVVINALDRPLGRGAAYSVPVVQTHLAIRWRFLAAEPVRLVMHLAG